ncbi:MAG: nucleotidyltransferase family protein [Aeromicrobium sp.]
MPTFQEQREVLKSVATSLKREEIPFALAGGYAVWARGGPESDHDVDFVVQPEAAEAARKVLLRDGHEPVVSNEDWLDKVSQDGIVVDIIHRLPIGDVDEALFGRCDLLAVDSVRMLVMPPTDLLLCRLLALGENSCNFAPLLGWSRSLREQIDWPEIERRAGDSPFARSFLDLLVALGVIDSEAFHARP